jgi:hypothetical protein
MADAIIIHPQALVLAAAANLESLIVVPRHWLHVSLVHEQDKSGLGLHPIPGFIMLQMEYAFLVLTMYLATGVTLLPAALPIYLILNPHRRRLAILGQDQDLMLEGSLLFLSSSLSFG